MVQIPSDGNCLFRAISHNFFGHEDAHAQLRLLVEQFGTLNSSIFERRMTALNGSTFRKHLKRLYHPNYNRAVGSKSE